MGPYGAEVSVVEFHHVPVLVDEVLTWLHPVPGGTYVDATVGGGGHARAIAAKIGPEGRLVGLDRDADAVAAAQGALWDVRDRVTLVQEDFRQLGPVLDRLGIRQVDGVLLDLGVSSHQLDDPSRGFSYHAADAPLDMRMDRRQALTAADIVNGWDERELARILREYGEERWASRIAHFIVLARQRRPLRTAGDLVAIIKAAVPASARRGGTHPARRTFQALRIATNDELGAIDAGLVAAVDRLRPGGRICVISFHSLEDRRVKQAFRAWEPERVRILTRKAVRPAPREVESNPRARSARLRAAERVA